MEIINRILRVYRDGGVSGLLQRSFQRLDRSTLHNVFYVYSWDLRDPIPVEPEKTGVRIIPCTNIADIPQSDLENMKLYNNMNSLMHRLSPRFEKNAVLWLIKVDNELASYVWTIRSGHDVPYFMPLTDNDVLFFDGETLKEFRGKRLMPYTICRIALELQKVGITRVYTDTGIWNQPINRSLTRTPFQLIGIARKFTLFSKSITIWTEMLKYNKYLPVECLPPGLENDAI